MTLSQYRLQHFISPEFLSPGNSASEGMKSYVQTEGCRFTVSSVGLASSLNDASIACDFENVFACTLS